MKIEAEDVNQVEKYLAESYKAGYKWVVFNTFGIQGIDDLKCFRRIEDAIFSCENVMGSFNCISNALRVLNPEKYMLNSVVDKDKLSTDIIRLGLESRVKDDYLFEGLFAGDYYPVIVPMQLKPETFESFLILDHKYPSGMVYEEGHELHRSGTFPLNAYADAVNFFDTHARSLDFSHGTRLCGSYLIGKFKDQKPVYDYDATILFNSAILFKEAANFTDPETGKSSFDIRTYENLNNVVIKPCVLAKYNNVTGSLDFFDDKMQKIEVDKRILSMDIARFYREKIEVKGSNSQRIRNDNNGPKHRM